MLERMKDIILADGELTTIGVLKEEDYNRVTDQLKKTGLIKDPPELREFYKVCN